MKSPLQLKENNLACSPAVKELIPRRSVVHCFPFLTGELELELLRGDRFVIGHTNNYVTYEFWRCVMTNPERVAAVVEHFSPLREKRMFYMMQRKWPEYKDPFVRSGMFFLLNQHSSTGLISSGEFVDKPLSPSSLSRLKNFAPKNFHIQFDDGEDLIAHMNAVEDSNYIMAAMGKYHLDMLESGINHGYEQTRLSHKAMLQFFKETTKKCVLTYDYHPRVLAEYKEYSPLMVGHHGQYTQRPNLCKEIVIANFRTQ